MITSKENKREISYILYTSGILISTYKIDVPGRPSKINTQTVTKEKIKIVLKRNCKRLITAVKELYKTM